MAGKVVLAVVTCAVAGCATYQPGSFALQDQPFSGSRATLGCLDLAIERRADQGSAAVLDYQFGNRCAQHTRVDLAHVRVIGRARDGREEQLAPYDPDLALRPLWLGGRRAGHEALAYPSARPHAEVCVELASLTGVGVSAGPRAQPVPERWQCFARVETGAPGQPPGDEVPASGQDDPAPAQDARMPGHEDQAPSRDARAPGQRLPHLGDAARRPGLDDRAPRTAAREETP